MKKLLIIVLVLIGLLAIAACASKADSTAKAFFQALEEHDFAGAKKYATEKSQGFLSLAEEMYKSMPENQKADQKKLKYTITEVVEDGDKATVTYNEWKIGSPESKKTKTAAMVKEDGKWLVDIFVDRFF